MRILEIFNSNLYLKLCEFLNKELVKINNFILIVKKKNEFSDFLKLEQIYLNIFTNSIFEDFISIKIERVLNPHYSMVQDLKPKPGNSSFFISIKITSDDLIKIDEIYDKRLSSLIRLFKNIFTVIDKASYSLKDEELLKYENLINEINIKIRDFLLSTNNKELINRREKLTSNIIDNLPFNGFYHMTHIDNLKNILSNGLLSHIRVYSSRLISIDISNKEIQKERNRIENIFGRNIQDYVPLYINPQNPMMDSKKVRDYQSNIILLEIIPHILVQEKNTLFSDGNAAQSQTNFYHNQTEMENINWQLLQEGKWINGTESHRIMCSEILIPEKIEVFYINKIILRDPMILENVLLLFPNHRGIKIEINNEYFSTYRLN